jgi:protein-S-isoprenylcysteine O-methyltransferase Ste14
MNAGGKDGAAVRIPPPLPHVAAVLAGIGLHEFVWPLPIGLANAPRVALALLVAVLGLALVGGAARLFRRTGQKPQPWLPTPEIIRTGVYRFTRNPMYVSFALFQSAIGIGWGNFWVLLLVPVASAVVYITAIRHEEVYLERKFGNAYLDYKKSVRRWL